MIQCDIVVVLEACHAFFRRTATMNRNLEVSIRIEMNETDAPLSVDAAEAIASGHYRVVIDGAKSLDIDAIENGLLNTSYPAFRNALATHLANEVKKMPNQNASFSGLASRESSRSVSS